MRKSRADYAPLIRAMAGDCLLQSTIRRHRRRTQNDDAFQIGQSAQRKVNEAHNSMPETSPPTEGTPLQQKGTKLEEPVVHHAPKVTTVELLGDLVFAVALKVSADGLEAESVLFPGLWVFMLRVFMLWNLWHFGAVVMNLSVRCVCPCPIPAYDVSALIPPSCTCLSDRLDDDGEMNVPDYLVMFAILCTTIFMARAMSMDNDVAFVVIYLCIRTLQTLYGIVRIACRVRPEHVSVAHFKLARKIGWGHLAMFLVAEVPPIVAAIFLHELRDGSVPDGLVTGATPHRRILSGAPAMTMPPPETGLLLLALVPALVWAIRLPMAIVTDYQRGSEDDHKNSVFDTEHLIERYELIILIFIGEMVFAAALPGSALLSVCCCMVLIACYLLYFRTRPVGVELSWVVSYTRQMIDSFVHMVLFCALGGLGAGYGLLIHHEATFSLSSSDAPVVAHGPTPHHPTPHASPSPAPETASHGIGDGAPSRIVIPPWVTSPPPPEHALHGAAVSHAPHVLMDEEGLAQAIAHGDASSCFALELLCLSSAIFLVASSISTCLSKDPERPTNLPSGIRCAVRALSGVGCGALFFVFTCDPAWHVAASIPAIMWVSVMIEFVGAKRRGWPFAAAAKPPMHSV